MAYYVPIYVEPHVATNGQCFDSIVSHHLNDRIKVLLKRYIKSTIIIILVTCFAVVPSLIL